MDTAPFKPWGAVTPPGSTYGGDSNTSTISGASVLSFEELSFKPKLNHFKSVSHDGGLPQLEPLDEPTVTERLSSFHDDFATLLDDTVLLEEQMKAAEAHLVDLLASAVIDDEPHDSFQHAQSYAQQPPQTQHHYQKTQPRPSHSSFFPGATATQQTPAAAAAAASAAMLHLQQQQQLLIQKRLQSQIELDSFLQYNALWLQQAQQAQLLQQILHHQHQTQQHNYLLHQHRLHSSRSLSSASSSSMHDIQSNFPNVSMTSPRSGRRRGRHSIAMLNNKLAAYSTPPDLRSWLWSLRLHKYTAVLESSGVTFEALCRMSDDELTQAGVATAGARRRLRVAIDNYLRTTDSSDSTSSLPQIDSPLDGEEDFDYDDSDFDESRPGSAAATSSLSEPHSQYDPASTSIRQRLKSAPDRFANMRAQRM